MSCPLINHLACKLPGEKEPRMYDVFATFTIVAGATLQNQSVSIDNRDAPYHLASLGVQFLGGTSGPLFIRLYNSRGFGQSDNLIRVVERFGPTNAAYPVNPSMVWPINSSIVFDIQNTGGASIQAGLFFFGFKVFDRSKQPC